MVVRCSLLLEETTEIAHALRVTVRRRGRGGGLCGLWRPWGSRPDWASPGAGLVCLPHFVFFLLFLFLFFLEEEKEEKKGIFEVLKCEINFY